MSTPTAPLPVWQNRDKVNAPDGGALKAKKEHTRPLYQINPPALLADLSRDLKRPATLDEIPDSELDRIVENGND